MRYRLFIRPHTCIIELAPNKIVITHIRPLSTIQSNMAWMHITDIRDSQHSPTMCAFPGVLLHNERDATHVRRDGSVPKPSSLERYFHRPLDIIFDTMDIITYLSNFGMSSSPPAYADGHHWEENDWPNDNHAQLVYCRRATSKVCPIAVSYLSNLPNTPYSYITVANNIHLSPSQSSSCSDYESILLGCSQTHRRGRVVFMAAVEAWRMYPKKLSGSKNTPRRDIRKFQRHLPCPRPSG